MRRFLLIAASAALIVLIVFLTMWILRDREMPLVSVNPESKHLVNSTGAKVLADQLEATDSSTNLCIFHLPIVQCMVSSSKWDALRLKYGLPDSLGDRTQLFNDLSALSSAYEKNWAQGKLKSSIYISDGTEAEDNLFAGISGISRMSQAELLRELELAGFDPSLAQVESLVMSSFAGVWKEKFKLPQKRDFTLQDKTTVACDFMDSNDLVTGISTPEYSVAFVPFRQPETGMLFVMPETDEDIAKAARRLSEVSILKQFKIDEFYEMDITIPVLDYESRIRMMEPLGPPDMYEFIAQKSQISLDAEGVEIKTQTFHGSITLCARMSVIFNRPFLFYIIDNVNHVVLYSGAVRNPKVR